MQLPAYADLLRLLGLLALFLRFEPADARDLDADGCLDVVV